MSGSVKWHLPQVNGILKLSSFPWLNVLDLTIITGLGLHQHQLFFFFVGGGGGVAEWGWFYKLVNAIVDVLSLIYECQNVLGIPVIEQNNAHQLS